MISVNECDPLRDEGVNFYRLLLRAGVPARCRQVMGTIHGTEVFPMTCPDISRDTARQHRRLRPNSRRLNLPTGRRRHLLVAPKHEPHPGRVGRHVYAMIVVSWSEGWTDWLIGGRGTTGAPAVAVVRETVPAP